MKICKAVGCNSHVESESKEDFCPRCTNKLLGLIAGNKEAANQQYYTTRSDSAESTQTSSGGDNDYWVASITHPKRLAPYEAECEDLIEHFQMTFQEGEAFKALWRKGQARIGNGKPGDTPMRNAEKVAHFGNRMVAMEKRAMECDS